MTANAAEISKSPIAGAAQCTLEPQGEIAASEQVAAPNQWSFLQEQVRTLAKKAEQLEKQISLMEAESLEDDGELQEAKQQAALMRATVDKISTEMTCTPTDKTGRKLMSGNRVATLVGVVEQVIRHSESDKQQMSGAESGQKATNVARRSRAGSVTLSLSPLATRKVGEQSTVFEPMRPLALSSYTPILPALPAFPALASLPPEISSPSLGERLLSEIRVVAQPAMQQVQAVSVRVVDSVRNVGAVAVDTASARLKKTGEAINRLEAEAAKLADTYIAKPAQYFAEDIAVAANRAGNLAQEYVLKPGALMLADAQAAVEKRAEAVLKAPAKLMAMAGALLPGSRERSNEANDAAATAKPPASPSPPRNSAAVAAASPAAKPEGTMLRALSQAATLSMPLVLLNQAVGSSLKEASAAISRALPSLPMAASESLASLPPMP
jgi:hypothetical protein